MAARHLFASITHFTNHNYLFVLLSLLTSCSGACTLPALLGLLTCRSGRTITYHDRTCCSGATTSPLSLALSRRRPHAVLRCAARPAHCRLAQQSRASNCRRASAPRRTLPRCDLGRAAAAAAAGSGPPLRPQPSGLTSRGPASGGLTTCYLQLTTYWQVYLFAFLWKLHPDWVSGQCCRLTFLSFEEQAATICALGCSHMCP